MRYIKRKELLIMKNAIQAFLDNPNWGPSKWDESIIDDFMDNFGYNWEFTPGNYKSIPWNILRKIEKKFYDGNWDRGIGKSTLYDICSEAQDELRVRMIKYIYDETKSSPDKYINAHIGFSVGDSFERIINRSVPRRDIKKHKCQANTRKENLDVKETKKILEAEIRHNLSRPYRLEETENLSAMMSFDDSMTLQTRILKEKVEIISRLCLNILTSEEYNVIIYKYLNNMSHREIGEILNINPNQIGEKVKRILKKIKNAYLNFYGGPEVEKICMNNFYNLINLAYIAFEKNFKTSITEEVIKNFQTVQKSLGEKEIYKGWQLGFSYGKESKHITIEKDGLVYYGDPPPLSESSDFVRFYSVLYIPIECTNITRVSKIDEKFLIDFDFDRISDNKPFLYSPDIYFKEEISPIDK